MGGVRCRTQSCVLLEYLIKRSLTSTGFISQERQRKRGDLELGDLYLKRQGTVETSQLSTNDAGDFQGLPGSSQGLPGFEGQEAFSFFCSKLVGKARQRVVEGNQEGPLTSLPG